MQKKDRKQELRDLTAALRLRPVQVGTVEGDKHYFPFHKQRSRPRGADPIRQLSTIIELSPEAPTCQLFSGFQGSGKSTELLRLAADLRSQGFDVIMVEGAKVLNLHRPLEVSDLLLSVAAAVGENLQERFGETPAKRGLFERIKEFFERIQLSDIELGLSVDLGLSDIGKAHVNFGKLKAALSQNPSFKSRVQDAFRGKFQAFLEAFRAFMREARAMLQKDGGGSLPVLLVDDLEKIQGLGGDLELVQRGIEQIFWAFHAALKIQDWHTVWTVPPYLQFLNAAAVQQYDGCGVLPMVRVWNESDPERTPSEDGLSAIRQCLQLRGPVDSLFLNDHLLDRIVEASSGHLRDTFLLVRDAVRETFGQDDPTRPLNEPKVEAIIEEYVSSCQKAVYKSDHDFLRNVATSRKLALADETEIRRASKLFDTSIVMVYRNGSEWFDVSYPTRKLLG